VEEEKLFDRRLAYAILRFTLGINLLIHGVVRLPGLGAFADGLVKLFAETPLPAFLVRPFAIGLTIEETATGLLLIVGLWTRWALAIGGLAMASLIFGTALRSDWNIVAIQMLYAAIYAALLAAREYDAYSADAFFKRR
jgi:thiosulfate dehydrogenase (quinone) large subunit